MALRGGPLHRSQSPRLRSLALATTSSSSSCQDLTKSTHTLPKDLPSCDISALPVGGGDGGLSAAGDNEGDVQLWKDGDDKMEKKNLLEKGEGREENKRGKKKKINLTRKEKQKDEGDKSLEKNEDKKI